MNLTAEQIKQALKFCANCECNSEKTEKEKTEKECALINMSFCKNYLRKQSLDYINRLEAENEKLVGKLELEKGKVKRLKEELKTVAVDQKVIKSFAIKEFAERLKEELNNIARIKIDDYDYFCVGLGFIDNILNEMVGEYDHPTEKVGTGQCRKMR